MVSYRASSAYVADEDLVTDDEATSYVESDDEVGSRYAVELADARNAENYRCLDNLNWILNGEDISPNVLAQDAHASRQEAESVEAVLADSSNWSSEAERQALEFRLRSDLASRDAERLADQERLREMAAGFMERYPDADRLFFAYAHDVSNHICALGQSLLERAIRGNDELLGDQAVAIMERSTSVFAAEDGLDYLLEAYVDAQESESTSGYVSSRRHYVEAMLERLAPELQDDEYVRREAFRIVFEDSFRQMADGQSIYMTSFSPGMDDAVMSSLRGVSQRVFVRQETGMTGDLVDALVSGDEETWVVAGEGLKRLDLDIRDMALAMARPSDEFIQDVATYREGVMSAVLDIISEGVSDEDLAADLRNFGSTWRIGLEWGEALELRRELVTEALGCMEDAADLVAAGGHDLASVEEESALAGYGGSNTSAKGLVDRAVRTLVASQDETVRRMFTLEDV